MLEIAEFKSSIGNTYRVRFEKRGKTMNIDIGEWCRCYRGNMEYHRFLPVEDCKVRNGKSSKQSARILDWCRLAEQRLSVNGLVQTVSNWIETAKEVSA